MTDFFNFHDTLFVVGFHWLWLVVALALGIWVGWYTAVDRRN
jgi:heme/copper-type cytochrome/quinol oxidase subunit 1